MLKLTIQSREGAQSALFYDPQKPAIVREDGNPLPVAETLSNLFPQCLPGSKRRGEVRLALGRGCNYRCAYCHQAPGDYQASTLTSMPEEELVEAVCRHADTDAVVQFWGGEPLIYFKQLRRYTELFVEKGFTEFCVITNGSLLKEEVTDFLLKHNFSVAISHDGPGQWLRGGDPLADPSTLRQVRRLAARSDRFSINPVMTRGNDNHQTLEEYISYRLGPVGFGEAVPIMTVDAQSTSCAIPEHEFAGYARQLYGYLYGKLPFSQPFSLYGMQVKSFLGALKDGCGVPEDRYCTGSNPDALVVDTAGSVLPCQSFTATDLTPFGEPFLMGHVNGSKDQWLKPRHASWCSRKQCRDCPVLFFCRGCCPYQAEDSYFTVSCQGRLHHYMALLGYTVSLLTEGWLLTDVSPFPLDS